MKFLSSVNAQLPMLLLGLSLFFSAGCDTITRPNLPTPPGSSVAPDIVVVGATPSGIAAAIEAARLGKQVTLLEPTAHVGGMMTNGLGYSDLYSISVIGGFPLEFFKGVRQIDHNANFGNGGAAFEPHVAEAEFEALLRAEPNITLVRGASVTSVVMASTQVASVIATNGTTYSATEFIDASYTGDLMAAAHVTYTIGRESKTQYGEELGGVGSPNAIGSVSSYVTPGNSQSGPLPHISSDLLGAPGSADSAINPYTYRLCVTDVPSNRIPFIAPANYNPAEFELLGRYAAGSGDKSTVGTFINLEREPNQKFDLNTGAAAFETSDEVGANAGYPDGTPAIRQQIEVEQRRYEQAFLYFLTTDPRIPASVQAFVQNLGLCKDEFTDNGGWPNQIYVREARRMISDYVMTESDITGNGVIPDSIGVGGYAFDTHATHVVNIKGRAYFEANFEGNGHPPLYAIPYRTLTPKRGEATNLIVTVDTSASHVAFSSLRVEVTLMIMGQAGGAAASLAIDEKAPVQDIDYGSLRKLLQAGGAVISP